MNLHTIGGNLEIENFLKYIEKLERYIESMDILDILQVKYVSKKFHDFIYVS